MLSIVLGSRIFKVVEFSFRGKKIAVRKAAQLTFDSDLFEAANIEKNTDQIKAFLKSQNIRPGKTIFSLSHHDIVSRELVLPLIPRKEAEAIVVNEIEEAPRFASNPYVYTYQMQEYPFDRKAKVIYYVFQKSLLEAAQNLLRLCGCTLIAFDICPLSLLNTLSGHKQEQAFVYIDDRISHLMICRGAECRASYFFNFGSSDLSTQSTPSENVWFNFSRDLTNLLKKFYDTEKSDQMKIFFTGAFPSSEDFFSRMQSLTQHTCAPFLFEASHILFPKEMTALDLSRDYAPAAGAMFRIQKKHHYFNIFNIWDSQRTKETVKRFWSKTIFIACVCLGFSAFFIAPLLQQSQELKSLYLDLYDQTRSIEQEIQEVEYQREALEDIKKQLALQAQLLSQIRSRSWRDVFSALNSYIAEDIWLENVSYSHRQGLISIRGFTLNLGSIAEMIDGLGADARFTDTRMVSVNERKGLEEISYEFVVECRFSEDLPKE